jgi:predicted MFS family arabinose efflux permease
VLVTSGVMLGVYAILEAGEEGWTSASTLGFGAAAAILLVSFVARQARIDNPLMPLRLFRSRNVAGANLVMAFTVAGMFAMFFLGALYMQKILGYDPLAVGLAFLPSCVVMGVLSVRFSDRLNMRFGARGVLIPALAFMGLGLLLFARTPVDGSYWIDIFPVMLLLGAGAGLAFPALMMLAMSGATMEDSGLASGIVNTTTQVGGAIGLALLATLATERTDAVRSGGASAAEALNSGYHLAYLVAAVLVAAAVVVALVVLKKPAADGEVADDAVATPGTVDVREPVVATLGPEDAREPVVAGARERSAARGVCADVA